QTGSNSWRIDIASPQMQKVANSWGQMIQKGYVQPIAAFTADWSKALASGQYAAFVGAAWSPGYELAPYRKPGAGWKAAPLPQWSSGSLDTGLQWSPWTTYFYDRYGAEASKAIKGQETWSQALANMQAAVSQYAQQQGYSVSHWAGVARGAGAC